MEVSGHPGKMNIHNATIPRFAAVVLIAGALSTSSTAFGQFGEIVDRVRQANPNSPTYYLKSAKAVEPNVCLYSNGDPTGVIGPLVFRNSYVATPNCRDFKACTDVTPPPDEPRPLDCGAEIPNSRYWSGDQKVLSMRSDGTASLEFESEEYVKVQSCREVSRPALLCTTGSVGLFRAEVEYEYPSGYESRNNWDRFQNLAGKLTETRTQLTWDRLEESRKTGNRKRTTVLFTGLPNSVVPAHGLTARVSHTYGDRQASIVFNEPDSDLRHYKTLKSSSDASQEWEVSAEIQRRPSPPVTKVSFIPATFTVSIEDKGLPDLLSLPGGEATRTKYLVTVYTEKSHRDETLIFQTEAENTTRTALFGVKMDHDALLAMKGKSKKIRVHVSAQRIGSPWVDGAISRAVTYETPKDVKFPKK